MGKKCIVCEADASYKIKDTSDFYCEECAEEHFADVSLLLKVEEEAQRLRQALKEKIADLEKDVAKLKDVPNN
ncbi:hypothetical protein HYS49_00235 [Candidatus Woesearchaeota archaeon]|nr:hypothetical protein [Candidatus Woesearchaeota archaeon]